MDGDGVIDRDGIGDGDWVVDGDGVWNGDWANDQVESCVTNKPDSWKRQMGDVFNGNKILLKVSVDRSAPEIFHVGYGSLQTLLVKALTPLSDDPTVIT
ncbi:hypothetical protein LguiB_006069 [Lonicera macranthoides]